MKKRNIEVELAAHKLNEHRIMLKSTLGKIKRQYERAYKAEGLSGVIYCLFH